MVVAATVGVMVVEMKRSFVEGGERERGGAATT
jgi:hypothetical protein